MLLFSKIVPAFNSQSMSSLGMLYFHRVNLGYGNLVFLGPLFLVAILYEAIGLGLSWTIKQLFWVPHRFRNGILVAGGWANIGDIRAPGSYLCWCT